MMRQALRLAAIGHVGSSLGGYAQGVARKYLILTVAGLIFLAALVFVILAAFWALVQWNNDWIEAAGIMAAILALAGFLIVFLAYGIAEPETPRIVSDPMGALEAQMPTVDDIGQQIERATAEYGPARVVGTAVVLGLIAGVAARKGGLEQLRRLY